MYFTAETQEKILRRFHFALDDDGALMLGRSEMLITHSDLFTPIDVKSHVFRKVVRGGRRGRGRVLAFDPGDGASQSVAENLREAAFAIGQGGHIVLDVKGDVVMANDTARRMFGLGVGDFGRPIQDLEVSYRPIELRQHLDALSKDLHPIEIKSVPWAAGDQERILDVRLAPLIGDAGLMGTSISYVDITGTHNLQQQATSSRRELEQAHEELQSTVEELETTNEELQSTNEELETTNEELQSTNEELETMNEELQSSNEELETMNEELRHRTLELDDMNAFLDTILGTVGLGVLVVDGNQHVQVWNGHARELWGLTSEEVEGQHVLSLDIGLPLENVKGELRAILEGRSEQEQVVLQATNRRGKPVQCGVTLLPIKSDHDGTVSGAIMMMEPGVDGASRR
jgi:two-component system CheB/CheR fusion protein